MSSGMLFGAKRPARQHSDNWVGVFDCDLVGTELARLETEAFETVGM